MTCSATGRTRSSPKAQAGQLDTTEGNMEQIKNQEKQHNTPIQVGYRAIFQPETQICKNQKTKTNNSNNNKTPKLLFPV